MEEKKNDYTDIPQLFQ